MPEEQGILQSVYDPDQRALRVVASNDSIQYGADVMNGSAGYVLNAADAVPNRWAFDAAVVERVKFLFVPPLTWRAFTIALMVVNDGAGAGNITWRYKHLPVVLGTDPSTAPTLVSTLTHAAPTASLAGAFHGAFPNTVTIVNGGFGEVPEYFVTIDRFASDASDTLANDASICLVNFIRQAVP